MAKRRREPEPEAAPPADVGRWAARLRALSFFLLVILLGVRPLLLETFSAQVPAGAPITGLSYGPEVTTALDVAVWLSAALLAIAAALRPIRFRWTGVELPGLLMLVAAVVSTLVASDKRVAITASVNRLTAVLFFVLLVQAAQPMWRRRLVLCVVVATSAAFAGKCLLQSAVEFNELIEQMGPAWAYESHAGLPDVGESALPPGAGESSLLRHRVLAREAYGYFSHSNTAGIYLVLGAFAVGGLVVSKLRAPPAPMRRGFALATAVLGVPLLLALAATKSRGAAAALLAGVLCWLAGRWLSKRRRWSWGLFWAVITGGMALLWVASRPTTTIGSLLFRGFYWRTAVEMVRAHPLTGVGAENFVRHYVTLKGPRMVEEVRNPHNVLLTYLSEWGVVGGAALLWAMLAVSWRLTRPAEEVAQMARPPRGPPSMLITGVLLLAAELSVRIWAERHYPISYLLYENGVLGAIWLSVFVLGCLDRNELGAISDEPMRGYSLPLMAGGVAFLLHGLIDIAWFTPGVLETFLALVAVVLVGRAGGQQGAAVEANLLRRVVVAASVAAVVAVLLGCWWPTARTHAALREARASRAANRPARVIYEAYHRAIVADRLDPAPPAEASDWLGDLDVEQALFGSPNPRPAIAWARRALERDPRDVVVQVRLSRLLDRAGDLPQAVRVMERAVELYPTYPAHRLELGELLYRLAGEGGSAERLAAAGEQFRRALELDAARVGEQQRRLTPAQVAWAERRLDEIGEARSAASLPAEE